MFFILAAMIFICGLFCVVDLMVSLLERADRRSRRHRRACAVRPVVYANVPVRSSKPNCSAFSVGLEIESFTKALVFRWVSQSASMVTDIAPKVFFRVCTGIPLS